MLLALGPAIDFAGSPLPPACSEYPSIVRELQALRIYDGPYERLAGHRVSDSQGGSKLVLPVEQRLVPVASGYAAHWHYAASRLGDDGFFPPDARLRAGAPPQDVHAALGWALDQGSSLEAARDERTSRITELLDRLRGCSAHLRAQQPEHVAHISSGVNVAGMAAAIDAAGYPARHIPAGFITGFPIWDPINTRVYRPITPNLTPAQAAAEQASLLRRHEAIADQVEDRVRTAGLSSGASSDAVVGVLNCTKKELSQKLIRGRFTRKQLRAKCPGGYLPMPRFGKPEPPPKLIRCIECAAPDNTRQPCSAASRRVPTDPQARFASLRSDGPYPGTHGATRFEETVTNPRFTYPAVVARVVASLQAARGIIPAVVYLLMAFFDLQRHAALLLSSTVAPVPSH